MIPDEIKRNMAIDRIGRELVAYLEKNRLNGVIDFNLRMDSETHFYLHPTGKDGETLDVDFDFRKSTYGSDVFGYVNKSEDDE